MQDDMTEATRLTRSGRLAEATALIQRTLGRRPGPAPAPGRGLGTPGAGPAPPRAGPGNAGAGPAPARAPARTRDRRAVPGRVVPERGRGPRLQAVRP